ncbi:MAG TPA: hypothetical protein VFH66_09390 [Mycobacteriales bacterium]|nr:hypothetical protein [Mycobacteriales bacterium]
MSTVAAAALLGACGAGGADVHTYSPSNHVRGFVASSFTCAARKQQAVQVDRAEVTQLLLCPIWPKGTKPVEITPASRLFEPIIVGLATPGDRYRSGMPCAAYADVDQTILAKTPATQILVDIPRDSCSHFDPKLTALLAQARESGG